MQGGRHLTPPLAPPIGQAHRPPVKCEGSLQGSAEAPEGGAEWPMAKPGEGRCWGGLAAEGARMASGTRRVKSQDLWVGLDS